jgi:hypothetical protein
LIGNDLGSLPDLQPQKQVHSISQEITARSQRVVAESGDFSPNDPAYVARLRDSLLELKPAQQKALSLLVTGSTHETAATGAGVSRETVNRWANHHPSFRAALNLFRASRATELANQAVGVREKALARVESLLDDANLNEVLAVIRAIPAPEPFRPADAHGLLDADVRRMAATVPDPPLKRGADGRIDLLRALDVPGHDVGE